MDKKKLQEKLGSRRLVFIPVQMLKITHIDADEDESTQNFMKASIEDSGLLQPVAAVGPYDDDTYEIISGYSRAARLAEIDPQLSVPCYVLGDASISEKEIERMRIESNMTKRRENINELRLRYCQVLEDLYQEDTGKIVRVWVSTADCSARYCCAFRTLLKYGSHWLINYVCSMHQYGNNLQVMQAAKIANQYPSDEIGQKTATLNYLAERKVKNDKERHVAALLKEEHFEDESDDDEIPDSEERDVMRAIQCLKRLNKMDHVRSNAELLYLMDQVKKKMEVE